MVFAFMPVFVGVSKASAAEKFSYSHDESSSEYTLEIFDNEAQDWKEYSAAPNSEEYFTFRGVKYTCDSYDFFDDAGNNFEDVYDAQNYWFKFQKEKIGDKYYVVPTIIDWMEGTIIAEADPIELKKDYRWRVKLDSDSDDAYRDWNNEDYVNVDPGTQLMITAVPCYAPGKYNISDFRYTWSVPKSPDNDYPLNDLPESTDGSYLIDTSVFATGSTHYYSCQVRHFSDGTHDGTAWLTVYVHIRTADESAAYIVTKKINALKDTNNLTISDKSAVMAAKAAYDALSPAQKQLVPQDNVTTLNNGVTKIHNLEKTAAIIAKISVARKITVSPRAKALKKRKVRITWKKVAGVSGFEVWQSAKKNGAYKKAATLKASATLWKSKKIKKGKKVFFKVRAFTKVQGKTVYGTWSKVLTVKLKK
jgi:hypothetical protein